MAKLLEQYEWYKLQKKYKIFVQSYNNVQYYCFQSAERKTEWGQL